MGSGRFSSNTGSVSSTFEANLKSSADNRGPIASLDPADRISFSKKGTFCSNSSNWGSANVKTVDNLTPKILRNYVNFHQHLDCIQIETYSQIFQGFCTVPIY